MNDESNKQNSEVDFPFYNDNPAITTKDIIILAIAPLLFTIYSLLPFRIPKSIQPFAICFIHLIPFLVVARGKMSLIVKKMNLKDVVRIIVTFILEYITVMIMVVIMKLVFNYTGNGNPVLSQDKGLLFWISVIIQLFGEELYKISMFLVLLIVMYKKTKKRTLSIVVSTTITLFIFGIIHTRTYGNIIQVLLLQGFGSLFCMYNYLKSKNILTSYAEHCLVDFVPFFLSMLHVV